MSLSLFMCCHVCKLPLLMLSVVWVVLQAFNSFAAIRLIKSIVLCVFVCVHAFVCICACVGKAENTVLLIKAPPSLMSPRKRDTIGTCRLATLHSIFGPQSCRQTDTRARTHARSFSAVTEVGRFTFLCPVIYTAEPSNVQYPWGIYTYLKFECVFNRL